MTELEEIAEEIADYAVGERNNAGMYLLVREYAVDLMTRKGLAAAPDMLAALQEISRQYENQNINHVEFRVGVKQTADALITKYVGPMTTAIREETK